MQHSCIYKKNDYFCNIIALTNLNNSNKMKKKILISGVLLATLLNACKKDEHNHNSVPQITINDPKKNHYDVGDTAYVNVVVADEHEMHEAKCWFITKPQNDTLWYQKKHSHSKTITFNSFYVIGMLPDEQQVEFIVVGENEAGKKATAKHSFEVHDH